MKTMKGHKLGDFDTSITLSEEQTNIVRMLLGIEMMSPAAITEFFDNADDESRVTVITTAGVIEAHWKSVLDGEQNESEFLNAYEFDGEARRIFRERLAQHKAG